MVYLTQKGWCNISILLTFCWRQHSFWYSVTKFSSKSDKFWQIAKISIKLNPYNGFSSFILHCIENWLSNCCCWYIPPREGTDFFSFPAYPITPDLFLLYFIYYTPFKRLQYGRYFSPDAGLVLAVQSPVWIGFQIIGHSSRTVTWVSRLWPRYSLHHLLLCYKTNINKIVLIMLIVIIKNINNITLTSIFKVS